MWRPPAGSITTWPPPRQRRVATDTAQRPASASTSAISVNHSKISIIKATAERGRIARAASERIAETMRTVAYQQYQFDSNEHKMINQVEEVQGPESARAITYYDRCTDFEGVRFGRPTTISAPSDTVWSSSNSRAISSSEAAQRRHTQRLRGGRDVSELQRSGRAAALPRPQGKLNGRVKQCSDGKQTLQTRLLTQVFFVSCIS